MEPDWTKQIQSTTICNTYYAFFVIYTVLFGVGVLNSAYTMFFLKGMPPLVKMSLVLLNILFSALAVTLVLFMYLMCDRALLAPGMNKKGEGFNTNMNILPQMMTTVKY
jgi:membrane glycosyltransferase